MKYTTDKKKDLEKYMNLSFSDFKCLASDNSLSMYGKIGFPDEYRQGKEHDIFKDIVAKMGMDIVEKGKVLLDIGSGCSELPVMILDMCKQNEWTALLVDSKEMLDQLPDGNKILKFEGYFPDNMPDMINEYQGKIDYIIVYSAIHYVFYSTCIFKFIDSALSLLKPGGKLLIGDIPNISKRKRFFSSETGVQFHKNFMQTEDAPEITNFQLEPAQIDDSVLFGIMQRYRGFGFETFLLQQNNKLPMYNRREDILICKI